MVYILQIKVNFSVVVLFLVKLLNLSNQTHFAREAQRGQSQIRVNLLYKSLKFVQCVY